MMRRSIAAVLLAASVRVLQAGAAELPATTPQCPQYTWGSYLRDVQVDGVSLLGPPPAAGSRAEAADVAAVLSAQRAARVAGTVQRAVDDSEQHCARFKDVLGAALKSPQASAALAVIQEGATSVSAITSPVKGYWKRPRPFVVSRRVARLADVAPGGALAHSEYPDCPGPPSGPVRSDVRNEARLAREEFVRDHTSYPSGHAAFGMACALLLAQVVPEQRAALFARGRQYGAARVIVGAHFPTDVAAGQTSAVLAIALMMQDTRYRQRFDEARATLREALGLPAQPPALEPEPGLFTARPAAAAAPAQ